MTYKLYEETKDSPKGRLSHIKRARRFFAEATIHYDETNMQEDPGIKTKKEKINVIPGKSVACEKIIAQLENKSKEKTKKASTERGRRSKKKPKLEQLGSDDSGVEPDQVTPKPKKNKRTQVDDISDEESFEVVDTDDDMGIASLHDLARYSTPVNYDLCASSSTESSDPSRPSSKPKQ
ncbi:hypothetical protein JTB14_013573 [Gonioctena quinquepunctata]|nr:hypothetical protein JTB14_013573 [Gonioctena quinquepunctata]